MVDHRVVGDVVSRSRASVPGEGWRSSVEQEIEGLGLGAASRIEEPETGLTMVMVDALIPTDVSFKPEGPGTFSLTICLSGRGTLSIDGAACLPFEGGSATLFTSNGHVCGENTLVGGQRLRALDIRFDRSLLSKIGGAPLACFGGDILSPYSRPDQNAHLIGFRAPPRLIEAAQAVIACPVMTELSRKLFLHGKAIEALSFAVEALTPSTLRLAMRPEIIKRVHEARNLLDTEFGAHWTIARLSRKVGLNERQLKEGFRELIGSTIHVYLVKVRIEQAWILLQSGVPVTETAMTTGFRSLSHFSHAFKKHRGVLPREIKRAAIVS